MFETVITGKEGKFLEDETKDLNLPPNGLTLLQLVRSSGLLSFLQSLLLLYQQIDESVQHVEF